MKNSAICLAFVKPFTFVTLEPFKHHILYGIVVMPFWLLSRL